MATLISPSASRISSAAAGGGSIKHTSTGSTGAVSGHPAPSSPRRAGGQQQQALSRDSIAAPKSPIATKKSHAMHVSTRQGAAMAAPATFSNVVTHDALQSTAAVPGPSRSLKLYQLRGTRTFKPPDKPRVGGEDGKPGGRLDKDDVDAAAAEILAARDPWYVQDMHSILATERIRQRQAQKEEAERCAEDARLKEEEERLAAAEAARIEAQRNAASMSGAGATSDVALSPAQVKQRKVADIVEVRKLRTRDVSAAIAEVDAQLASTAKRYVKSRRCVRQSVELLGLKEEELRLARERSLRLYAAASTTLMQQGVAQGRVEKAVALAELQRSMRNAVVSSSRGEMISVKAIRNADAIYANYERIEYLWTRLRAYARAVGRASLSRRQQERAFDRKRRMSCYNALADAAVMAAQQSATTLRGEAPRAEDDHDVPPPPPPDMGDI